MRNNTTVRDALYQNDVKMWRLAKLMNISEATLYRLMRDEIPGDKQREMVRLIEQEAATAQSVSGLNAAERAGNCS